ncbi:ras GTPase-activating-like protein IQGAP2 [Uloborus diversus]|uniref:ras GTPase-activating-like protein IQGAP2 n=1 Tax=Uloborus diversus TaxID=327109 RepID=UPI002409F24D|nr:ras GTPase-activating-like protein IQGAP2 [Uloborus diversus]
MPWSEEHTIDEIRLKKSAYQYLCHLEEARLWIQDCLKQEVKPVKEFEVRLRNGVVLAKLGNHIAPHIVPLKKIYDVDEEIYGRSGLQYHHIDNINLWIAAMSAVGLPELFYPNAFDVYGKKNMPKAVYCIHALSLHLYRFGEGIKILDLWGKIKFSDEEIDSVSLEFTNSRIQLPSFKKIRCILNSTVSHTNVNLNAAVIAINIAISQENSESLLIRRNYLERRARNLKILRSVKLIQRCWRAFKVKQNLKLLTHSSSPSLSLIRNIICMLEISNDDYSEELRLHNLQSEVIHIIRYNQDLLKELDEMDLKIGLLIKNYITLEELVSQKKSKEKNKLKESSDKNLNNFSRMHQVFIEKFENLLYLLQTDPNYLAKLIIALPINEANSFVESVVFAIYNYGSTPREEFFLLKLLHKALEEEIIFKVDKLSDMIKDDRFVVKIVLSLYRKIYQPENLKTLFQPLLHLILKDNFLLYSLNPIDIYRVWQNEIEIESGKKSELPYDVTVEEALCHAEVNHRFNTLLDRLVTYAVKVCNAIINSQNILPYGIMYMAKILKEVLMKKFPYASKKELYQIVGNFVYYRFINPIIIAPDAFEILNSLPDDNISHKDRMKLSLIAKFLQFAAVGKEYSEDHLVCLNPYLRDCHENLLSFFEEVCNICNLEDHFNICPFSEALMTTPKVYLNPRELISLYKLLTKNEYILAPDSSDILHEVLEEFDVELLNDILEKTDENILSTELCLSLKCNNKFEDDTNDEEKIYLQTKFMLITLMQVFPSQECILEFLNLEMSSEMAKKFEGFSFTKQINSMGYNATDSEKFQNWKTLSSFQKALQYNLNILELNGYVSIKNNYQDILNDIAEDIVNRWKYRISRKNEIEKLLEILKKLKSKQLCYFEKLDYYNKYIAVCLEKFKLGEKLIHRKFPWKRTSDGNLKNKVLIYSGSKLHEKGILLEIQGLTKCQLKNIFFEISSSEDPGIFNVKVKFMGKYLETVIVDIQDLLSYKYKGIAVIKLNECVRINNNFLLHLLNVKFYNGKK